MVGTDVERLRSSLAAIVDSSDDAIISKNLNGIIATWNPAAERMFGYTEAEAVGRPITIIIPFDLFEEEADIIRRLRLGGSIEHFETRRIARDGRMLDVSVTVSPVREPDGAIVGASKIVRDITASKRARRALVATQRRLAREVAAARLLQSISTRLISQSTEHSLFAQILDAAMELMGSDCSSIQMLSPGRPSLALLGWRHFHPKSAAFWHHVTAEAGSTCGVALRDNRRVLVSDIESCAFMAGTQDLEEYRRSGIRAVQSTPLRSRVGRPLGMISTHWRVPHTPSEEDFRLFDVLARQAADLIERTRAEESLAAFNRQLIEAQEAERRRIARDLHDDIGQRLVSVGLTLDALRETLDAEAHRQSIDAAREQVSRLVRDLHTLSHRLHPHRIRYLGIADGAAALCREIASERGVEITFSSDPLPQRPPDAVAVSFYRVLQEALQNAIKHGAAERIDVTLRVLDAEVVLMVEDFGSGFDVSAARGRGLGLISMEERVSAVGGQLTILSKPHQGTKILANVPLSSEQA